MLARVFFYLLILTIKTGLLNLLQGRIFVEFSAVLVRFCKCVKLNRCNDL